MAVLYFFGLMSVPWELSSQSLAGLALDPKLVWLEVHGCQINIIYRKLPFKVENFEQKQPISLTWLLVTLRLHSLTGLVVSL